MFTTTLLIDCDFHENQRRESHIFLGDVNEFLAPLSIFIVRLGEIWYKRCC